MSLIDADFHLHYTSITAEMLDRRDLARGFLVVRACAPTVLGFRIPVSRLIPLGRALVRGVPYTRAALDAGVTPKVSLRLSRMLGKSWPSRRATQLSLRFEPEQMEMWGVD